MCISFWINPGILVKNISEVCRDFSLFCCTCKDLYSLFLQVTILLVLDLELDKRAITVILKEYIHKKVDPSAYSIQLIFN